MNRANPSDFDFELPESSIAQRPLERRALSRLQVTDRRTGQRQHHQFVDIPRLLPPRSLLVVNDTRVIPARLLGHRPTGGRVEVLLLDPVGTSQEEWLAWVRPSARVRVGMKLNIADRLTVIPEERLEDKWRVRLVADGDLTSALDAVGKMPLPPYIRRLSDGEDQSRYQTIFAQSQGAVAAPTAGLHFTSEVMAALAEAGHETCSLTLHVGAGTFAPLRDSHLETGRLHPERYQIDPLIWQRILDAKSEGRPIVAVGTTSVRTLETVAAGAPLRGQTDLFIRPGFAFKMVDHLITNFHLPKSSLLMLVSAFAGRESVLDGYREAVESGYRFFSYGDASLFI